MSTKLFTELFQNFLTIFLRGKKKIIRETIDKLSGKKTILLISHKISLLEHCDNIIVIYNGEINQNGTFKKLISKKGFFKTMYDSEKIKKS